MKTSKFIKVSLAILLFFCLIPFTASAQFSEAENDIPDEVIFHQYFRDDYRPSDYYPHTQTPDFGIDWDSVLEELERVIACEECKASYNNTEDAQFFCEDQGLC